MNYCRKSAELKMNAETALLILGDSVLNQTTFFGVLYIGYEMYMNKKGRTNIAHDAHLLGAAFGIIFTIILSPSNVISNFIQEISTII